MLPQVYITCLDGLLNQLMHSRILKTYLGRLEEQLSYFLLQCLRDQDLVSIRKQVLIEFLFCFLILFSLQVIKLIFIERKF